MTWPTVCLSLILVDPVYNAENTGSATRATKSPARDKAKQKNSVSRLFRWRRVSTGMVQIFARRTRMSQHLNQKITQSGSNGIANVPRLHTARPGMVAIRAPVCLRMHPWGHRMRV